MRNGWRVVWAVGVWLALEGAAPLSLAAPRPADPPKANAPATNAGSPARLTVELVWSVPPTADAPVIDLSMSEGRILGVVEVPESGEALQVPETGHFRPTEQGVWRIAYGSDRMGRVRVRLEAPLGASLKVEGATQVVPFLLAGLVDGPLRSVPPARIDMAVERVAWDVVEVSSEGSGFVAPGSSLPLTVGLNVLSTDTAEVLLNLKAELRPIAGGDPIWTQEVRERIPTNSSPIPSLILPVRIPESAGEGTYALEFKASWEPPEDSSNSRSVLGLSRLLTRRRKTPAGRGEVVRKTTLVVVSNESGDKSKPKPTAKASVEVEVDTFDFSKPRGHRPSASGRTPLVSVSSQAWKVPDAALVEETRRDRLRGWISRGSGEPIVLAPADAEGLAWTAIGLKTQRGGRPHRLSLTVQGDAPANLAVALIAPGSHPRLVLEAVAAPGSALTQTGPSAKAGTSKFSWVLWPDAAEPVLVLVNRDPRSTVRLETATLTELSELVPVDGVAPNASGPRWVALSVDPQRLTERFGGAGDLWAACQNLGRYASTSGANAVVLSEHLSDRPGRLALHGQASPDPLGPDRLDIALRLLDRQGLAAWVELDLEGCLPGLPCPDDPKAVAEGLVRINRHGLVDGSPAYQLTHPKVREALARRISEAAARRGERGNVAGLVIRLGQGPTLLGRSDTGLDDATFQRFVSEMFDAGLAKGIPGLDVAAKDRFETRARYVDGVGKTAWLTWRAKQVANLYTNLVQVARTAGPGTAIAVVTPSLEDGPVREETERFDLLGLGPDQAWKSVGLDFSTWANGEDAPIVWRGVTPSEPGELDHDLATSPELDDSIERRTRRGLALNNVRVASWGSLAAKRPGGSGLVLSARAVALTDELIAHGLAAFDARWMILPVDAVAGREEHVLKFARLVTSLPPPNEAELDPSRPTGFSIRAQSAPGGTETVISMVNDTPYPILLETVLRIDANAKVFDLARGFALNAESIGEGKRVVLALGPYGISAISVDVPGAVVVSAEPHPGAGVLDELKARSEVISATLARLNRSADEEDRSIPPNPGFEPPPGSEVRQTKGGMMGDRAVTSFPALGWKGQGEASIEIDTERPHSGQGSLRLTATGLPASALSEGFAPVGRPSLTINAWLRGDRPESRVRIWLEGQAAGQPFSRKIDLQATHDWRPVSLLASSIPGGGLDLARMRFELLSPGRLWIDDLEVSGAVLTEPERLNARRDLLAALSAFHEKRYGDFARLAGSHWAHHVSADLDGAKLGPAASSVAERTGLIRTGEPSGSGLPMPRRLR